MRVLVNEREIKAKLWIFDKDGTLVDLGGWEKIMAERLALIEKKYGTEARRIAEPVLGYKDGKFDIKHILYTTRQETSSKCAELLGIQVEEILELFKRADSLLDTDIFQPIRGARELLSGLMQYHTVIVLTNDLQHRTEKILSRLNIPHHRTIGADTFPYYKPDPRLLLRIMDEYNITNPEDIVVVGDSTHDIELAKNTGALSIGVLSGVEGREGLKDADHIINGIYDIKLKGDEA